ncbi:hypothetical protein F511_12382 [Dorcoceras hygrometricum]|uniref:Uncharacterized protein n=1 Tax=Dorcoceras hygrometricum TaxID=472368 RepID=A0A2Z7ADN4_9LAMI|nr:hypothetical protein F511_12382 [Dorcoceras hygrometricum]
MLGRNTARASRGQRATSAYHAQRRASTHRPAAAQYQAERLHNGRRNRAASIAQGGRRCTSDRPSMVHSSAAAAQSSCNECARRATVRDNSRKAAPNDRRPCAAVRACASAIARSCCAAACGGGVAVNQSNFDLKLRSVWLRPVSRENWYFTVGGGRYRQSGPRPETGFLRQPALEGLKRSAWKDSPRRVGRKQLSGERSGGDDRRRRLMRGGGGVFCLGDTGSRGPTTIVAPESQSRTCPTDHGKSV